MKVDTRTVFAVAVGLCALLLLVVTGCSDERPVVAGMSGEAASMSGDETMDGFQSPAWYRCNAERVNLSYKNSMLRIELTRWEAGLME